VAYIWFKSISPSFLKGSAMIRDASDFNHVPTTTEPEWTGETVAGYRVHPAASMFPLMQGQEFDELVESIAQSGLAVPIEIYNGQLIDGRNRARAVEVLRDRGLDVELPVTEWQPREGETVEGRIFNLNVLRRHLTDDQRAVAATILLPVIRASRAARQAASRFHSGETDGDTASAAQNSASPVASPRSSQDRFNSSTAGSLSQLANVSRHKSTLAIGLADDVVAGVVPREEMAAVLRGEIPLRKVSRRRKKSPSIKSAATEPASGDNASFFDDHGPESLDEPVATETEVRRRWERLKQSFAIADHREVRRLMVTVIAEEQRQFDR